MDERLFREGKLKQVRDILLDNLKKCRLCPRQCNVNRIDGEIGFCRTKRHALVSSAFLHFGEEPELVGRGGSGTIFFSYCNLGCRFCQNYTISHLGEGDEVEAPQLATMMLALQKQGAENINFVTPTHVIAQIVEALCLAVEEGLNLPLVYNCGGYESLDTLRLVEGIFDIYMPDVKYSDNTVAERFSAAPDYWDVVQEVLKEMHRQVGDLVVKDKAAKRGLLVRHLLLPSRLAGSFKTLQFIKEEVSPHTYVNIMDQYRPCHEASAFKELSRRITMDEHAEAVEYAKRVGLHRGF
ncbi:MAG: radical SAM protein [Candidatus Omnitrophota bacterium]|nr:MAG: radical SAM protein [Candidatus Omnitrophota bacterium]